MMTIREMIDRNVTNRVGLLVQELNSLTDNWEHLYQHPNSEEVLEHWIVSDWLAEKLESKGELIERSFYNPTIWGRTTSGQAITMDGVIQEISEENNISM